MVMFSLTGNVHQKWVATQYAASKEKIKRRKKKKAEKTESFATEQRILDTTVWKFRPCTLTRDTSNKKLTLKLGISLQVYEHFQVCPIKCSLT